jgi:hypothetical protein
MCLTAAPLIRINDAMRYFSLVLILIPLAAAPGLVMAEGVVLFEDGRSMRVEAIEARDEMMLLTLEGGGSIAVPRERIVNWADLGADRAGPLTARLEPASDGVEPWRVAAGEFAELIGEAASRHRIDPALLTAVVQVESAFDPLAISPKGASGLLQLMPATAQRFGVQNVFDVSQNVEAGARYLAWLLERYAGRTDLALAGYNAGETAVDRYGGIPPYRETRSYVSLVLEGADRLESPAR